MYSFSLFCLLPPGLFEIFDCLLSVATALPQGDGEAQDDGEAGWACEGAETLATCWDLFGCLVPRDQVFV